MTESACAIILVCGNLPRNCLNRPLKGLFMYNYFQIRTAFDAFPLFEVVVRQKSHLLQQLSEEKIEISIEGSAIITGEN